MQATLYFDGECLFPIRLKKDESGESNTNQDEYPPKSAWRHSGQNYQYQYEVLHGVES